MYLRKSSESEERQALSIPAQRSALSTVVAKRGLFVVEVLEESKSAKRPGRVVFNAMLERIAEGEADGIICWKLDRLARNPIDGGQLMWQLGKGEIAEIATPDRIYSGSSDDKLLMSIIFGMATKYVDDLSENVKRGNYQALKSGRWIGPTKLGYVRDPKTKAMEPDPERFEIVRQLWLRLLDGVPVADILREATDVHMLRTPRRGKRYGGGKLSRAQLDRILRDPIYAGLMKSKGVLYRGAHQPMITYRQYEKAQKILRKGASLRMSHEFKFPYRGLFRCGKCGSGTTARELVKKNGRKYVYYHCSKKVGGREHYCRAGHVPESVIDEEFEQFLRELVAPRAWLAEVDAIIEEVEEAAQTEVRKANERLIAQLAQLDGKLVRARELLIDGVLDSQGYAETIQGYEQERFKLRARLDEDSTSECIEPVRDAISLLEQAPFQLKKLSKTEKRGLFSSLVSNASLTDKKVLILAKEPFATLGKGDEIPSKQSWREKVRTLILRLAAGEELDSICRSTEGTYAG